MMFTRVPEIEYAARPRGTRGRTLDESTICNARNALDFGPSLRHGALDWQAALVRYG